VTASRFVAVPLLVLAALCAMAGGALARSALPRASAARTAFDPSRPDVLVVGGTPAAVAAALAAARRHDSVTLVASGNNLGDILTDGLMDQWDLNVDESGKLVERGIFSEMHAGLGDAFAPEAATALLAGMIAREPRIVVRYGEIPVGVEVSTSPDGRRLDGVMFKRLTSNTTTSVHAPIVIDATDSADVAAMAGAHYDIGRQDTGIDDRMQAVTEMFTLDGVDWNAAVARYDPLRFGPGGSTDRTAWGYATLMRTYRPTVPDVIVRDLNLGRLPDGSVTANAIDVVGIDGLDPQQLFQAKRNAIAEAPRLVDFLRAHVPGFARARIGRFAEQVYVRETRHIEGLERLTSDDVWKARVPDDSIGLASYPLDVHPVDTFDTPAFASSRHVYGVPFGALVPKGFSNVMLASPAISATHEASGSARIVATTIEEGEAAGAAAAFANREHLDVLQIATNAKRVADLRKDLAANGAVVGAPSTGHAA
jgi:hypothetical protein